MCILYGFYLHFFQVQMSYNVPAVSDVFFAPDKEKCEAFSRKHKTVAEQNGTKGVLAPSAHPTALFCSPSRRKAAKQLPSCYVPFFAFILL